MSRHRHEHRYHGYLGPLLTFVAVHEVFVIVGVMRTLHRLQELLERAPT